MTMPGLFSLDGSAYFPLHTGGKHSDHRLQVGHFVFVEKMRS